MNKISEINIQSPKVDYLLDFAVIGAGVAGLTAASKINDLGFQVAVFEKARGTGGRMSSKRVAKNNNEYTAFDLGCVSLTAKSNEFAEQLENWHVKGITAPWWKDHQGRNHYVAVPRNSALTRHLSKDLECHFSTRVVAIEQVDGIWQLYVEDEDEGDKVILARAKNVIIATPPTQAQDLLPANSPFKGLLDKVEVSPQWVMAVEIDNSLSNCPAIQYPNSDIVFSISQEHEKPERSHDSVILQVQATANWTSSHLELSHEEVSNGLIQELERYLGQSLNIVNRYAHRWLYSCVAHGLCVKEGFVLDEEGLGLVGDYINSSLEGEIEGVESAWLSGKKLAEWVALNGPR